MAESEEFETQSLEITPHKWKEKAVSTTENDKTSKTRWSDDEVGELIGMLEERVCLLDVFPDVFSEVEKITTIETERKGN